MSGPQTVRLMHSGGRQRPVLCPVARGQCVAWCLALSCIILMKQKLGGHWTRMPEFNEALNVHEMPTFPQTTRSRTTGTKIRLSLRLGWKGTTTRRVTCSLQVNEAVELSECCYLLRVDVSVQVLSHMRPICPDFLEASPQFVRSEKGGAWCGQWLGSEMVDDPF